MTLDSTKKLRFYEKRGMVLSGGQAAFLLLLLGLGSSLILATIEIATFNTILLLFFVAIIGLFLCRRTQIRLDDPSLKILSYFWLIKLGITLFLLYVGWMPMLDPATSTMWGYDPQGFYIQAQKLIDHNWLLSSISLNYVGILYYYGAIFYIFGHNPVIPALINAFVTLIASLYLVKVGYEIKAHRSSLDWTLAFVLLLPEVLWFDVMTSRETLMAALLLFPTLTAGRYLARLASVSLSKVLTVVGLSVLAIAAVRASMLLPLFASIVLMVLFVKPFRDSRVVKRMIMAVAIVTALIVGLAINTYLTRGGYFEAGKAFRTAISASKNIALNPGTAWSKNSIGKLLMPEGLLQSILFLPPRMVLYLVVPLPNVSVPVSDLVSGSWYAWQNFLSMLSSIINVLVIPYALASLVQSIKIRKTNPAPLIFHIPYWITFMVIVGGNLIILVRYRVMATLLLLGCAWLGARTCSKSLIIKTSLFWYGLLTLSALFYVVYKFGFA